MRSIRRLLIQLFTTSFLFISVAEAGTYSVEEFSFPIPKNWREFDKEELANLQRNLQQIHEEKVELLAGFCPSNKTVDEFPKILIQLNNSGRVSYENLQTIDSHFEKMAQTKNNEARNKAAIELFVQDQAQFDLEKKELTGTFRMALVNAEPMVACNRTIYTQTGFISISYQCSPAYWTKNEAEIRRIVDSLAVSNQFKYKVSVIEEIWPFVMLTLILSAMFGYLFYERRKRQLTKLQKQSEKSENSNRSESSN